MAARLEKTRYPGIFRRGSRYLVIWRFRGRQSKESFATLAEAREAQGRRAAGERRPKSKVLFGEFFEKWIETYSGRTSRGFSETTRDEYRRPIVAFALPQWKTWKLAEIEHADVRDLLVRMRKEDRSTSQIKKLRAALSVMFATAMEDRLVPSNPAAGVRIPPATDDGPPEDDTPKALTRAELGLLIESFPPEWRLFFEFLTHTGLRISEAIGLRWRHIDLGEKPKVQVREQLYKGKRKRLKSREGRRDIPLSPRMSERLREQRRNQFAEPDSPVFTSASGTELRPENVYRRILAPTAIGLGLTKEVEVKGKTRVRSSVSFHTFRHTCASLLFEAGRNVKQVQAWLGHAEPGFTLATYIHLMDTGIGDAAFLDVAVGGRRDEEVDEGLDRSSRRGDEQGSDRRGDAAAP